MATHRLPTPGSDNGTWGDILNDFLSQSHNADGTLQSSIIADTNIASSAAISKTKLASSVQTSLTAADNAAPKPAAGTDGKPLKWNNTSGQLEDATTQLDATYAPVRTFDVKAYGATGNGTTDDTAAIQAAATALVAVQDGTLFFPAGHYKVTTSDLLTLNYPGLSVVGEGIGATFIEPTFAVTGDVIRWQMNPWTIAPAGRIANLTIDGANAGAGACGLHVGDVFNHCLDNVVVQNFGGAGSLGIHFDNVTHWTEECTWTNVYASLNKIGVLFDVNGGTNSWGYNRISLRVNSWGGQTGVAFKGGGIYYGGSLQVTGNLADAGCIGIDVRDTCSLNGAFAIALESANTLATGLKLAAGTYFKGAGYVDLANGITTNTNAGSFNLGFGGWFNVPGISAAQGLSGLGPAPVFSGGVNVGYTSATMSAGNGVPNWVSTTGTLFLRGDTPTVTNQRIYICTNGAAGTWVGIA